MTPEQYMQQYLQTNNPKFVIAALNDISKKICTAVNPTCHTTAPLVISVLNMYADAIEKAYPGAKDVAKDLEALRSMRIVMPAKIEK